MVGLHYHIYLCLDLAKTYRFLVVGWSSKLYYRAKIQNTENNVSEPEQNDLLGYRQNLIGYHRSIKKNGRLWNVYEELT